MLLIFKKKCYNIFRRGIYLLTVIDLGLLINISRYLGGDNMKPGIIDVANYFVRKGIRDNAVMTPLKLQKMCYYTKALSLVRGCNLLSEAEFRAWVHGPANWELYRKYVGYYKDTCITTLSDEDSGDILNPSYLEIVNDIYNTFKNFSGKQLEERTHSELPWREARKGLLDYQNGDRIISEITMKEFYSRFPIV